MSTHTAARWRTRLAHVYWIGGGSAAGKSSVARRLSEDHGLRLYSTDDMMSQHAEQLTASDAPHLARFTAMDMDDRWVRRSPEAMLDSFHWFRGEGFRLIVEDLSGLSPEPPVVAEGFRLLPDLVAPVLTERNRAVWLLPTPEFRRSALDSRGTAWEIPNRTTDPARAMQNLLSRDALFTQRLVAQTERLGLPVVHVDVGMSENELAARVARTFGLQ